MLSHKLGHSNYHIPAIGFGTWQVPPEQVQTLVKDAVDAGYTHIDCAAIYMNEAALGGYFQTVKDTRPNLFVTSKLWSWDHQPERVRPACEKTLSDLKLDYLDLYLMHNPCRMDPAALPNFVPLYYKKEWILETWRVMEKLVESDLAKTVGVSNFTTTKLTWLLDEASYKPVANQVELHPYLPQEKLINFCNDANIHVTAYSPLGTPASSNYAFGNKDGKVLLQDEIINEIAKKNKITPAQVLIAWGVNRGTSVLVKSSSHARIVENLNAAKITLNKADLEEISKITYRTRYLPFNMVFGEGHTVEEFWDNEYL